MTIAKENKEFINSLIEYYISESESYKEIAEKFRPPRRIHRLVPRSQRLI